FAFVTGYISTTGVTTSENTFLAKFNATDLTLVSSRTYDFSPDAGQQDEGRAIAYNSNNGNVLVAGFGVWGGTKAVMIRQFPSGDITSAAGGNNYHYGPFSMDAEGHAIVIAQDDSIYVTGQTKENGGSSTD